MSSTKEQQGSRPTLLDLPIELFGSIIPNPALLFGHKADGRDVCDPECQSVCFIPMKRKPRVVKCPKTCKAHHGSADAWWGELEAEAKAEQEPVREMLFALSHTCKQLRAYCLPLLWSVLHVGTVDELGSLRDLFRDSPSLPLQVRHFSFHWAMGDDVRGDDPEDAKALPNMPLVELAFGDRKKYFEMHEERSSEASRKRADAMLGKNRPNYGPPPWLKDAGYHYAVPEEPSIIVSGKGPDGFGEDKRIKNVEQLNACLTELVESFAFLATFRWATFVMSVPEGVMQVLEKLESLQYLWFNPYNETPGEDAAQARTTWPQSHSYWRCAKNLIYLEVIEPQKFRGPADDGQPIKEVNEADIWKADAHPVLEQSYFSEHEFEFMENDKYAQARRHAWQTQRKHNVRTVINAAKGGKLRYLFFWSQDEVYAIRSLLPAWVGVIGFNPRVGCLFGPWLKAAASLRACMWHYVRTNKALSNERRLTGKQVQAMPATLLKDKSGGGSAQYERMWPRRKTDPHPLLRYFGWLQNDADLAHKVAEAWNALVDQGEVDEAPCCCEACKPDLPRATFAGYQKAMREKRAKEQAEKEQAEADALIQAEAEANAQAQAQAQIQEQPHELVDTVMADVPSDETWNEGLDELN